MATISISKVRWENKKYPQGHPNRVVILQVEDMIVYQGKILIIPKNKKYSLFKIRLSDCDIFK